MDTKMDTMCDWLKHDTIPLWTDTNVMKRTYTYSKRNQFKIYEAFEK